MAELKKHRNVLYVLVVMLALMQVASFVVLSIQVTRLNIRLNSEIEDTKTELTQQTVNLVERYDESYQHNFNEISLALSEQKEDFSQEITLLKSARDDFSDIAEDSVKSIVTVTTSNSIGSGFFITSDGYIVTNYHVLAGGEERINVITYNSGMSNAELVGYDVLRDVALLKTKGDFEPLNLADSDLVQPGQKVIAIGNPLGLSFTVTEGIVSAVGRRGPNGLEEYIQTDVSLNPGNSGGPLIDKKGEVIGLNNFKIGGAESLGFALESNSVRESVGQISNQTIQ